MDCSICEHARTAGEWVTVLRPGDTHCRDCHKTFRRHQQHCTLCHETFGGQRGAAAHKPFPYTACAAPADKGLRLLEGVWVHPAPTFA